MSDQSPRSAEEIGRALARLSDDERDALDALARQLEALGQIIEVPDPPSDQIWSRIEEELDNGA
jgi:hypothetical protein